MIKYQREWLGGKWGEENERRSRRHNFYGGQEFVVKEGQIVVDEIIFVSFHGYRFSDG